MESLINGAIQRPLFVLCKTVI